MCVNMRFSERSFTKNDLYGGNLPKIYNNNHEKSTENKIVSFMFIATSRFNSTLSILLYNNRSAITITITITILIIVYVYLHRWALVYRRYKLHLYFILI